MNKSDVFPKGRKEVEMSLPNLDQYDQLYSSAITFVKRIIEEFFTDTEIKILEVEPQLLTYSADIFCKETGKEDQKIKFLVLLSDPRERCHQWHRSEAHYFEGEDETRSFATSPHDGKIYEDPKQQVKQE